MVNEREKHDEIEPLLPAIYEAVVEPAPSGIMFADGIRLSGLEILAQHRIEEGMPLCVTLIEPGRWGLAGRIDRCLKALRLYGPSARSQVPRLRQLEQDLAAQGWDDERINALGIPDLIQAIQAGGDHPTLRPLGSIELGP